jgi:hypothetical protein
MGIEADGGNDFGLGNSTLIPPTCENYGSSGVGTPTPYAKGRHPSLFPIRPISRCLALRTELWPSFPVLSSPILPQVDLRRCYQR